MKRPGNRWTYWLCIGVMLMTAGGIGAAELPWNMTDDERQAIRSEFQKARVDFQRKRAVTPPNAAQLSRLNDARNKLANAMQALPTDAWGLPPADVAVWDHMADISLLNNHWVTSRHYPHAILGVDWGTALVDLYKQNPTFWQQFRGHFILGYRSAVDRSVQPYGVTLPNGYDPARAEPYRLIVNLHGRSFWNSEPTWMVNSMIDAELASTVNATEQPDEDAISVQPFGRFITGYREAGETDVWEVIQDVMRRYAIDPQKIVLTGFSMGGGGTMRVGLLNPGVFAGIAPHAMALFDYTSPDSVTQFSNKLVPMTVDEIKLRITARSDVGALAMNGTNLPVLMGVGTKDGLSRIHRAFETMFDAVKVPFISYYVGGVPHSVGPLQTDQYRRFLNANVRTPAPKQLTFATAHLRHHQREWVRVEGLQQHYNRGVIRVDAQPEQGRINIESEGITSFSLNAPEHLKPRGATPAVVIDGTTIPVANIHGDTWRFGNAHGQWRLEEKDDAQLRKQPGLTGPVSDAFIDPFLCVEPTGKPWNAQSTAWSVEQLNNLRQQWAMTYRGRLPVKKDTEVTQTDRDRYHLVLFGDPGSNVIMAEMLDAIMKHARQDKTSPSIQWSKSKLKIGDRSVSASSHAPVMIYPNPLADGRYIVLNGRLADTPMRRQRPTTPGADITVGDFALVDIAGASQNSESVIYGGFFNEEWAFEK